MAGSMNEASIVLKSNSSALARDLQSLSDKVEALRNKNAALNESYSSLSAQLVLAKKAVNDATKELRDADTEANRTNLQNATLQYKNLTDRMQEFKQASSDTRKEINALNQQMKTLEDTNGNTSTSDGSALTGQNAAISAVGKQLSSAIGNSANVLLSSALGSEGSTMISSVLEGTIAGAAAGALAGPVGALIGGVVGALGGAISGATQIFQNQDDAFKSYVADQYDSIAETTESALSAGIETAASREQTMLSFSTLMGDETIAGRHLGALQSLAVLTPYEYDDLTGISKKLLSYGYNSMSAYKTVSTITDAASALNWSTSDMETVGTVLGRMTSTNKASLEYLNQLSDRALPVFQWLADALGVSQAEVMTMISKGQITGTEAAGIVTSGMGTAYAGSAERQSQTYTGLSSTLSGVQTEIENAMGEGYNEGRKSGIQAQISFLTDNSELETLNRIIGEGRAYTENLSEQYTRDAINAMLGGALPENWSSEGMDQLLSLQNQYTEALARYNATDGESQALAAADIEATYEAVQALAETEYEASGYAQDLADTAEKQYQMLQEINTSIQDGFSRVYTMNSIATMGLARNAILGASIDDDLSAATDAYIAGQSAKYGVTIPAKGHATGLQRVPYDNYPALLHEGERVLTAQEARNYGSARVILTGNQFVVRQESDIDAIAEAIAERLERAAFVEEG